MKTLKIIAFILGFALVLGGVGSLEVGNITELQCLVQGAIGVLAMWLAVRNTKD